MKKELKPYYDKLQKKKHEFLDKYIKNTDLARGEMEIFPGDMVDQATDDYAREFISNLSDADLEMLRKIDKALKKIEEDANDYGICEAGGEQIDPKRLLAVPWAEYCIECQERLEKEAGIKQPFKS